MQPLEIAMDYAADGLPVFPCRAATGHDPETGEVKEEKAPLTSNGLRAATTFRRIIERWWADNPDALIGMPTGAKAGFFVLDLDIKADADGHDWLADREEENEPLPLTRRVRTANGGTHVFFRYVDGVRNRGALGRGVDIRGEGGFIIAAGSVMADGRAYTVIEDAPIADAPAWLLKLVLPPPAKPASTAPLTYQSGMNDVYVDSAVNQELRKLADTSAGGRGYALNASAFSLGQLVASGALSQSMAEAGLYDAAVANGLVAVDGERETWNKIRRGLAAGMKQPRDIPAPAQQDNTRLIDISRMIKNGLARAGGTAPSGKPERDESAAATAAQDESAPIGTADNDNEPQQPDLAIMATPFTWLDPKLLPRREFVYGKHLIRKYVSVTVEIGRAHV